MSDQAAFSTLLHRPGNILILQYCGTGQPTAVAQYQAT
jgi:hypothetical protein